MFRITNKVNLLAIALLLISTLISWLWFSSVTSKTAPNYVKIVNNQIWKPEISPMPSPSPVPSPSPSPQIQSHLSADGKMELIIQSKTKSALQNDYDFYVKNQTDPKNEIGNKLVFNQTLDKQAKISIPFNTWSPDNKYFFVKQSENKIDHFLLFKASGEKFEDQAFLDITNYYLEEEIAHTLVDVTGWAAAGLLIVTTKQADQTQGPSYWFDLSNQSFIPLFTRF